MESDLHRPFVMRLRNGAPGTVMAATVVAALMTGACGSEVVISDEEDELDLLLPIEQGGGDPGGVEPGICFLCGAADCTICSDLPGATHRCDEGQPAPSCVQLGGLFDDGGEFYTCWSCQ